MAKILLEAGSEVNQKSNSGHTPLHLAAQTGKSDLIELILRYGMFQKVAIMFYFRIYVFRFQ